MPSSRPDPTRLMVPLSAPELEELDRFLLSEAVQEDAMLLAELDGFLTAILVGPTTIAPHVWMQRMWGHDAEAAPEFESMAQAQRVLDLVIRHMNGIAATLERDPASLDPLFDTTNHPDGTRADLDGTLWATGFMEGIELARQDWQPLFDDPSALAALRPIVLLGSDALTEEEEKLTEQPDQCEALTRQLAASATATYRFWLPHRRAQHARTPAAAERQSVPKTGRNDPCPCGSGKKFKKCCGAPERLH